MLPLVLLSFMLCNYFSRGFSVPIRSKTPPYLVKHVQTLSDPYLSVLPWFLVAECTFLYFMSVRSYKNQSKPIVTLSSEGIGVDTQGSHLVLIYWDEIEEVRNYNLIYRYVGIVPKNLNALIQRLGMRRAWLLRFNAACIALYKPFGLFVAPINIPQVHLSISADELLSHIQHYQRVYSQSSIRHQPGQVFVTEGVWPPPPRNEDLHS